MKAVQISKYGAPVDVVTLVEIPQPGRRDSPKTNAPAVIPLTAAVPQSCGRWAPSSCTRSGDEPN